MSSALLKINFSSTDENERLKFRVIAYGTYKYTLYRYTNMAIQPSPGDFTCEIRDADSSDIESDDDAVSESEFDITVEDTSSKQAYTLWMPSDRIIDNSWLYRPYAKLRHGICYYWHIVLQLTNRVIQFSCHLSLPMVKKIRRDFYGEHNAHARALIKKKFYIFRKCRDFLAKRNANTHYVQSLIHKLKLQGNRAGLMKSYIFDFREMICQLICYRSNLANMVLDAITQK